MKSLTPNQELLAALKDLVDRCDGEEGVCTDGSNVDTSRAHVAIAKAEGLYPPSGTPIPKTPETDDHECDSYTPDIPMCSSCGEHSEFCKECGSYCCGANPIDTDPDTDMER